MAAFSLAKSIADPPRCHPAFLSPTCKPPKVPHTNKKTTIKKMAVSSPILF
jgi:hypothetical protein